MFIVFEGIDGAGKGYQRNAVSALIIPKVKKLYSYEFPNHEGFLYKNLIKPALLEKFKLSKSSWFLSFALDQLLLQEPISKSLKNKSTMCICDGYYTTNIVYQCLVNKNFSLKTALEFASEFEIIQPELNIFIDVDPRISLQRKMEEEGHDEGLDINERDLKKQYLIREGFLKMAKDKIFGRWVVIDGNGGKQEVTKAIMQVITKEYKFLK